MNCWDGVVVADAEDGVAAYGLLLLGGHGKDSGFGDGVAFERFVAGEAEDEGIAGGEAALEGAEFLDEALVEDDEVLLGVGEGLGGLGCSVNLVMS